MSGTSQGDVVRVTNNAGRSRPYTQQWGRDAHTTMVEARNPDAAACARTPRGEVCATKPATTSTAPTPGLGQPVPAERARCPRIRERCITAVQRRA